MPKLTIETLENYLKTTYQDFGTDQSLFMKLVEEIGELAEVLNIRNGNKFDKIEIDKALGYELADIIHYVFAIAAVNQIDLEKTIIEKDLQAAKKYQHEINLKEFMLKTLKGEKDV